MHVSLLVVTNHLITGSVGNEQSHQQCLAIRRFCQLPISDNSSVFELVNAYCVSKGKGKGEV